ncbi:MAG: hypothetical protein P1R58_13580 [bacterium]|nr:hypothetical protein [bacterium]
MKRILLTLLLAGLTFSSTQAAGLTGCLFGTVQTFDDFKHTDGGARIGFVTPFDSDRGMYLRVVAGQVYVGEDDKMQTFQPTMMVKWYLGKKYDFWWTVGGDVYVDGPNEGADAMTGFGASRAIKTFDNGAGTLAQLSAFLEVSVTDGAASSTGSYGQINLGITFGPK